MFKGHIEVREVRLLWKKSSQFCSPVRDGQQRRPEVCSETLPDGAQCKRLKQNMTKKELVGLPLASKI